MLVLARADHAYSRESLAQRGNALDVVEVMMGQPHIGQRPADAPGFLGDRLAVRRVDRGDGARLLVADEQAEIVVRQMN